jgi:hypothetical protein
MSGLQAPSRFDSKTSVPRVMHLCLCVQASNDRAFVASGEGCQDGKAQRDCESKHEGNFNPSNKYDSVNKRKRLA